MSKKAQHPFRYTHSAIHNPQPDGGFTLIEVLVALTLLAVGLTTLMELFSGSLSMVKASKVYTTAVFLADQKMGEAIISRDTQPQSGNFNPPFDKFNYTVEIGDQQESKWQVQVIDDILSIIGEREQAYTSPSLRKIRVTINWEEGHRERKLHLETLQAVVINYEAGL